MVAMMVNLSEKCCEQRCQVIVKALVEKGAAIDFKDASPVNNVHVTRSHCVCASGLPRQNTFARGPSRCCSSSCRFLIKRNFRPKILFCEDLGGWVLLCFTNNLIGVMDVHGPMVPWSRQPTMDIWTLWNTSLKSLGLGTWIPNGTMAPRHHILALQALLLIGS